MTTRYYCGDTTLAPGIQIQLSREESRHLLKVMRARIGEQVILFGNGCQYTAVLASAPEKSVAVLTVENPIPAAAPPRLRLTSLIPWIKSGKTEFLVQKLTEIGAQRIIVFHARHEVARGDNSKLERLHRVAIEACKQCERASVPEIITMESLAKAIDAVADIPAENRFLLHERDQNNHFSKTVAAAIQRSAGIVLAGGPEGGWHPEELQAVAGQIVPVSLGPRILRAETAPIVAAAAALTLAGDI